MDTLSALNHTVNFIAPALFVALALSLLSRFNRKRRLAWRAALVQLGLVATAGSLGLLAGLWVFGMDGKLASYALLVVGCGTAQWLLGSRRASR
ncbi:MAG: hypothetical protein V4738_13075 [Pseudomonadota bacterium]